METLPCKLLAGKEAVSSWPSPGFTLVHRMRKAVALVCCLATVSSPVFGAGGAQSDHADFAGLVGGSRVVEKMQDGFGFTEGPAASRLGFLLFTDVPANRIWKYIPQGSAEVFEGGASASKPGLMLWREASNGAVGLTFDRQGRLLACEKSARRVTRTEKDGAITVLADSFDGRPLHGPDDLLHAIDGSTYFTDPPAQRDATPGTVYQIRRTGELHPVATDLAAPNGLAFSPDQLILYVSDAVRNEIRAYGIVADGKLDGGRLFARLEGRGGVAGGLKTDVRGNVYCAGPGGIWIFDRDGKHLGTIAVPEQPANLAWGDNYSALYITARSSLYRVKLKASGSRTY